MSILILLDPQGLRFARPVFIFALLIPFHILKLVYYMFETMIFTIEVIFISLFSAAVFAGNLSGILKPARTRRRWLRNVVDKATSYTDFQRKSREYRAQQSDRMDPFVEQSLKDTSANYRPLLDLIRKTTQELAQARQEGDFHRSALIGAALCERNHLSMEDMLACEYKSFSWCGGRGLPPEDIETISQFQQEVSQTCEFLAGVPSATLAVTPGKSVELDSIESFFSRAEVCVGKTALCLSGGGALAMFHLGVIKALVEADLYDSIPVITGSSGGSIIAAVCAMYTSQELVTKITPKLVTDFHGDGMQAHGPDGMYRWFPPMKRMIRHWIKEKTLMGSEEFQKTTNFYFGDTTFEEAFQRTGKTVCISVTGYATGAEKLILNHVLSPRVLIRSAVATSCALPGLMPPSQLLYKDTNGKVGPFVLSGNHFIDGSLAADLPIETISSMFNVSNFLISQVNPQKVLQLRRPDAPRHPLTDALERVKSDLKLRIRILTKFGVLPAKLDEVTDALESMDIGRSIVLIPRMRLLDHLGFNALYNPSEADMAFFIRRGEQVTWPYIENIRNCMFLELGVTKALKSINDIRSRAIPLWASRVPTGPSADSESSGSENVVCRPVFEASMAEVEMMTNQELRQVNNQLSAEVHRLQGLVAELSGDQALPASPSIKRQSSLGPEDLLQRRASRQRCSKTSNSSFDEPLAREWAHTDQNLNRLRARLKKRQSKHIEFLKWHDFGTGAPDSDEEEAVNGPTQPVVNPPPIRLLQRRKSSLGGIEKLST